MMLFRDRQDAGRQLAERLVSLNGEKNVIVLGIPRGGVVVAAEVARALNAPLDVFIAHKLGARFNPELAIGALTSNGELYLDQDLIEWLKLSRREVEREVESQRLEIERRLARFRSQRLPCDITGKRVVLVDDGVATGSTMRAALQGLRKQSPRTLVLAIPVGPPDTVARLARECDQLIALDTPEPFWAVGRSFSIFDQVKDETVMELLAAARPLGGEAGTSAVEIRPIP